MFCPNCGNNVPEDSAFCPECGTPMKAAPQPVQPEIPVSQTPMQPVYQAPVYQEPVYQQPAVPRAPRQSNAPAGRKPAAKPSKAASVYGKLVLITMLVSLVLIVVSVITPMNVPFYDIPAMSVLLDISGGGDEDVDMLLDDIDQIIEEMEDDLKMQEDVLDDDEIEMAEEAIECMEELHDNCSINNFAKLVNLAAVIDSEVNSGLEDSEIGEMMMAVNVIRIGIMAFFFLPALFHLLGGLRKSGGLTITAMVFTAISQLIFSGLILAALSLVVGIIQVTLCDKNKKAAIQSMLA